VIVRVQLIWRKRGCKQKRFPPPLAQRTTGWPGAEMPRLPSAGTSSSTRRVPAPWMYASWTSLFRPAPSAGAAPATRVKKLPSHTCGPRTSNVPIHLSQEAISAAGALARSGGCTLVLRGVQVLARPSSVSAGLPASPPTLQEIGACSNVALHGSLFRAIFSLSAIVCFFSPWRGQISRSELPDGRRRPPPRSLRGSTFLGLHLPTTRRALGDPAWLAWEMTALLRIVRPCMVRSCSFTRR